MKYIILYYYVLFIKMYLGVSEKNSYNCWERKNYNTTIDDLSLLLKHFKICLSICHQLKNNELFMVTSQLKSSMSVLRDLYYHGQISFLVSRIINNTT